MARNYSVLVISPHRDDAAFSCGILLHALMEAGARICIANIFTKSDYAPYLTENDTDRVQQVSASRSAEDAVFVSLLTARTRSNPQSLRLIDLGWQDEPIRSNTATPQISRSSVPCADDVVVLSKQLLTLEHADLVLLPLAIGNHGDHILARDAADRIFPSHEKIFYEDLPYACRISDTNAIAARVAELGLSQQAWVSPAAPPGTKRAYASCYPTQIAMEVADEMESYAQKLGVRERFYGQAAAIEHLKLVLQTGGAAG